MSASLLGTVSGLTAARWGTSGAGTSSLGIIMGCRRRKGNNKSYVKNPDAETIAELQYDDFDEVSLEILALDASALPDNGDSVTAAGVTGLVQDSEENFKIESFVIFTVNFKKFAAMTLA
ncbi:hypothetical protein P0Y35_08740 [Kiritimatiellaeota bacterium B1221]|nr:hypothetical protein [Kiritimatiellaeota bacterium B1221]